jgi:hypothetical protein
MTKQLLIWTALPHGIDTVGHKLRLSVFLSPRLSGDSPPAPDALLSLSEFPNFLPWPANLEAGAVSFSVQCTGTEVAATIVRQDAPDASLWVSLFGGSTPVRPYVTPDDPTGRPVLTYAHAAVRAHVQDSFIQTYAASPVNVPTRKVFATTAFPGLHTAFEPARKDLSQNLFSADGGRSLSERIDHAIVNARALAKINGATLTPVFLDTGDQPSQFAQVVAFHHRSQKAGIAVPDSATGSLQSFDFHQMLTSLCDYPELLRRLGLAIDLEIDAASIPSSTSIQPRTLRVIPRFTTSLEGVSYSPFTAYILDGHFFLPAPHVPGAGQQPEFIAGMVNLLRPEYQAVEIDVDDAALKSVAAVSSNARLLQASDKSGEQSSDAGEESSGGLPTLRSSGLGIVRAGHADSLHGRFLQGLWNSQQLEADLVGPPGTATITFFAEDLTRGWRVDVLDTKTERWHSLHRRIGNFVFPAHAGGELPLSVAEEGILQPAPVQVVGSDGNLVGPEMYIHEGIFQWRGWSLAAQRPGKAIARGGPQVVLNKPQPDGLPFAAVFTAEPGTLPRLRFGRSYQFRMRAVDLAGNSLSVDEADDALLVLKTLGQPLPVLPNASKPLFCQRFEPIPAPLLVPRSVFTEGESLAMLVIRSNRGMSADDYSTQLNKLVAGASSVTYSGVNERHLAPPKMSQFMAERFSLLDDSFGTGNDADQTYSVASREKGSFIDNFFFDANGSPMTLPPGTLQTITTSDDTTPVDGNPSAKNPPKEFVMHTEATLLPTYLPDLLSRGASLFDLPGAPDNMVASLDRTGALVVRPETVHIEGRSSLTQIDFGPTTLWPNMRPFRLQLREYDVVSGTPSEPTWDNDQRVLSVALPPAGKAVAKLSSFLNGVGDVSLLGIWQWLLDAGRVSPTTDSLDLAVEGASWLVTPSRDIVFVHAVQQPLVDPVVALTNPAPRDFSTTFTYVGGTVGIDGRSTAKLDVIAYWTDRLDGSNLFRNASAHVFELPIHLPDEVNGAPSPDPSIVPIATYDAETDTVTFQPRPHDDQSGRRFLSRHAFGDTKHRNVTYQVIATSRFREYFPPQVTDFTRTGTIEVNVLSSARPTAPRVLYTLPTFEWDRIANADGSQIRVRKPSGVRVYMDRPWFVSGDGEQLAVVLADPSNYPPQPKLAPCVTQWGLDPIWDTGKTGNVTNAPLPLNFGGIATGGLWLEEVGDTFAPVFIAAHDVEFDSGRNLWYCDILVDPGEVHFPFVRLALARFQPNSIPGLELSRVVLADSVQLLPQRTVTLQPAGDPNSFLLAVSGLSYVGSAWGPGPLDDLGDGAVVLDPPPAPDLIQVTVEQRLRGAVDEAGWQAAPAGNGTQVRVQSAVKADSPGIGPGLWTGTVTLPSNREPGQFRVVIREYEQLFTDERRMQTFDVQFPEACDVPHQPCEPPFTEKLQLTFAPGAPAGPTPRPGRLVFAETIEL